MNIVNLFVDNWQNILGGLIVLVVVSNIISNVRRVGGLYTFLFITNPIWGIVVFNVLLFGVIYGGVAFVGIRLSGQMWEYTLGISVCIYVLSLAYMIQELDMFIDNMPTGMAKVYYDFFLKNKIIVISSSGLNAISVTWALNKRFGENGIIDMGIRNINISRSFTTQTKDNEGGPDVNYKISVSAIPSSVPEETRIFILRDEKEFKEAAEEFVSHFWREIAIKHQLIDLLQSDKQTPFEEEFAEYLKGSAATIGANMELLSVSNAKADENVQKAWDASSIVKRLSTEARRLMYVVDGEGKIKLHESGPQIGEPIERPDMSHADLMRAMQAHLGDITLTQDEKVFGVTKETAKELSAMAKLFAGRGDSKLTENDIRRILREEKDRLSREPNGGDE